MSYKEIFKKFEFAFFPHGVGFNEDNKLINKIERAKSLDKKIKICHKFLKDNFDKIPKGLGDNYDINSPYIEIQTREHTLRKSSNFGSYEEWDYDTPVFSKRVSNIENFNITLEKHKNLQKEYIKKYRQYNNILINKTNKKIDKIVFTIIK